MRKLLKVFNPFIALFNFFKYMAHLEMYRDTKEYEPYDFKKDTKYF